MSIYRGYSIFRKYGGIITKSEFSSSGLHGVLSRIGNRRIIQINTNDNLEEQIKTVLHELIHIGFPEETPQKYIIPGFPLPKGISQEQALIYLNELDKKIDEEMEQVYKCQPILINHLRRKIQELYLQKLGFFI